MRGGAGSWDHAHEKARAENDYHLCKKRWHEIAQALTKATYGKADLTEITRLEVELEIAKLETALALGKRG